MRQDGSYKNHRECVDSAAVMGTLVTVSPHSWRRGRRAGYRYRISRWSGCMNRFLGPTRIAAARGRPQCWAQFDADHSQSWADRAGHFEWSFCGQVETPHARSL